MKQNEEDEIQVLGTSPRKRGKGRAVRFGVCVLCVLFLAGAAVWLSREPENGSGAEEERLEMEQPEVVAVDSLPRGSASSVVVSVDSINDVKMRIYTLKGLLAGLSFDMPGKSDTTVFLVVPAADIRHDNGEIVGDFVLRGKRMAHGKRKTGYCAVLDGQVTLGNAADDEMMERCVQQKGDFFRQYALVMDGEIQENRLKGKALRRALAWQGDNLYFVESCNRESIYDFAEALADIGFSKALYLVGGSSYGWWRENGGVVHDLGRQDTDLSLSNRNYLVFRCPESH